MALILADRVRETSTTTGTGALTLAGAVVGYQTFSSAIGNTNTTYYAISNPGVAEWEVGIGTYATTGNTLTRTTIIKSSNSNAAVSFSAGTKDVFVTYPATKSVYLDASGNASALGIPASGTVTNLTGTASININGTVGATTPSTGAFTTGTFSSTLAVTGITTVAAGTALLPAIVSTTGTADTGLWFPSADTIAASTAGTERMRIDSSGNVGIGNSSPVGKLDVTQTTSNTSAIILAHSGAGGGVNVNYGAQINVTGASNTNTGVYSNCYGATNNFGVRIINPPASATNWALYSDATAQSYFAGNVAIGTTGPTGKLEVVGGRTLLAAASEPFACGVRYVSTGGSFYFGAASGSATPDGVFCQAGGSERMRITDGGSVGIGTSTPTLGVLQVANPTADSTVGYFGILKNNGGSADGFIINDDRGFAGVNSGKTLKVITRNDALNDTGAIASFETTGGSAINALWVGISGNVGIGTSAPAYKLEISTDSAGKPGVGGLWTVVSDERIKSNIVPANLDRCYEIVKSVPLKYFGFAPGVYTDDQIQDKHNLGWIAQDVQKVFKNAVSVKPFTLKTDIPDGTEEYEEQDFTLESVEKTETSIQVINGKPVQVSKVIKSDNKILVFDTVDVVDEAGAAVMVDDKPLTYQMPRMITKTRPKVCHDVIEDCLDLNGAQMLAALYGAVQALMEKVETLENRLTLLEAK